MALLACEVQEALAAGMGTGEWELADSSQKCTCWCERGGLRLTWVIFCQKGFHDSGFEIASSMLSAGSRVAENIEVSTVEWIGLNVLLGCLVANSWIDSNLYTN